MNQAIRISSGSTIDLSTTSNGDAFLATIAGEAFKCTGVSCAAELSLCSYRIENIPAPYFKTISGNHVSGCPNTIAAFSYDPSDLTSRRVGQSAFNAIKRRYSSNDKAYAIYNPSSRSVNIIPRANAENNPSRTKVKVGPILYDGSVMIEQGKTYMISCSDASFNLGADTGHWVNLPDPNGIGIKMDAGAITALRTNPNSTIVILPKYVTTSRDSNSNRRYTTVYQMMVIESGQILYENQ